VSVPLLSSPLRTLLAGTVMAVSAVVLAAVGETIGVPEPWPVLLVAGAGLLVGIPRLQHGLALGIGATFGLVTTSLGSAVLPDSTAGIALANGVAVLLVTLVTLVSHGRLRFGMQLVGWAAMTALAGPLVAPDGPTILGVSQLLRGYVAVLIASGLGLLVAQVAQLLAAGVSPRRAPAVAPVLAIGLLLAGLLAAPGVASAADGPAPTVQHRQLVVRSHSSDGTPGRGVVITRLEATGTGGATVVLDDQAVTRLRRLSGFGEPSSIGRRVTHELTDREAIRTVAELDRPLPVTFDVAYRLDGVPIAPAALVGRSGRLEVTYTLTNRTAEARELRYFDTTGRARVVTRDVAVPFAGTLDVTLDGRFSRVRTDRGRVVTDHTGRQQLVGDMVLFGPVGAPVQSLTWTADVRDALVPAVRVGVVPVGPAEASRRDVAAARADVVRTGELARALRDIADSGGLLRTGLRALGVDAGPVAQDTTSSAAMVLAQMEVVLTDLLGTTALASADVNEARALIAAQEQRALSGAGNVYGLLTSGPDVPPDVRVGASVVYVLEVVGSRDDGGPGMPLRFGLALVLMAAVGLLGRAVGTLTGVGRDGRTVVGPTSRTNGREG